MEDAGSISAPPTHFARLSALVCQPSSKKSVMVKKERRIEIYIYGERDLFVGAVRSLAFSRRVDRGRAER